MAKEIGCSRSTIQRSLDRLAENDWVEVKPAQEDVGTPSCSHFYRVRLDVGEPQDELGDAVEEDDQGVPTYGQGCPTMAGTIERPLRTNKREDDQKIESVSDNDADQEDKFEEFFTDWPTSTGDSRVKSWRAWKALSPAKRGNAVSNSQAYIQHLKRDLRRKILPSSSTYLTERSWKRLPASSQTNGGEAIALQPFTRPWWCHLHTMVAQGERVDRMITQAKAGTGFTIWRSDLPDETREAALVSVMIGSEAYNAWSKHLASVGVDIPAPENCPVVFMPQDWPPTNEVSAA